MLTFFLHYFDIALRYVLSFLLIFCQNIVIRFVLENKNLGILGKRKYFQTVYMKKDKVKETICLNHKIYLITFQITDAKESIRRVSKL